MAESTESTALDLGLALPTFLQFGAPDPGLVRSVAHEAETAGFDRLWCFDHILWHRPFIDALTATTIGLGCNPNYNQLEGYQGSIADVRLYAGVLTDAAIQRLQGTDTDQ